MIKYFAKPFNVVYRTEGSINKKIESIKDQIEFEKYKLQNKTIEFELFTREKNEERLRNLERELEYYEGILYLKGDPDYLEGITGGQIITLGSIALGAVIELVRIQLRK